MDFVHQIPREQLYGGLILMTAIGIIVTCCAISIGKGRELALVAGIIIVGFIVLALFAGRG